MPRKRQWNNKARFWTDYLERKGRTAVRLYMPADCGMTSSPFKLSEVLDEDLKPLQPVKGVVSRPSTPLNLSEVLDEDLKPLQPVKGVVSVFP